MQAPFSAKLDPSFTAKALADLETGKCVAIPTETVYGLAADATNGEAVARIFELKGRPSFNPLICHVDGLALARELAVFDTISEKLADAFWPGPLTLVLPLNLDTKVHPLVCAGLDSVGVRWPKGIASEIISEFGKPLAAPSANRSGRVSPTTAQHVQEEFADTELTVIDTGPCEVGLESTVVRVSGGTIEILRPGAVTVEMIFEATGVQPSRFRGDEIIAPGMMRSHYAPNAQLELNCTDCPENAPWLQFGAVQPKPDQQALNLSPSGNLVEAAANLYGFLKQLDRLGASKICVSPIPNEGLGVAINDRLERASAPRETS